MIGHKEDLPLTIATNRANIFFGCKLVNLQFQSYPVASFRRFFVPDSNCLAALGRLARSVLCVSRVSVAIHWVGTRSSTILTATGSHWIHLPSLALFEHRHSRHRFAVV
jgi:hypothetical protein